MHSTHFNKAILATCMTLALSFPASAAAPLTSYARVVSDQCFVELTRNRPSNSTANTRINDISAPCRKLFDGWGNGQFLSFASESCLRSKGNPLSVGTIKEVTGDCAFVFQKVSATMASFRGRQRAFRQGKKFEPYEMERRLGTAAADPSYKRLGIAGSQQPPRQDDNNDDDDDNNKGGHDTGPKVNVDNKPQSPQAAKPDSQYSGQQSGSVKLGDLAGVGNSSSGGNNSSSGGGTETPPYNGPIATPPTGSCPSGYKELMHATPARSDLTNDPYKVDAWSKRAMGAGLSGNSSTWGKLKGTLAIAPAPDGRPAVEKTFLRNTSNKPYNFGLHSYAPQKANSLGLKTLRMSMDIWAESNFDFNNTGLKLYGISGGGSVGAGNSYPPMSQNGWYSRIQLGKPTKSGILLGNYHYYLNRHPKPDSNGKYWGTTDFGTLQAISKGRWSRHDYEITLNTPGQSNGSARLYVDGKLVINQKGVLMQKSNWGFKEFFFGINDSKGTPNSQGRLWWSNIMICGK